MAAIFLEIPTRRRPESQGGDTLICFSHLRWDFVFQRPQHLMTRFAHTRDVIYVEEPVWIDGPPTLASRVTRSGVNVVVPHITKGLDDASVVEAQRGLLNALLAEKQIVKPLLWYYTPLSLAFSDQIDAHKVVYDCMDELSAFRGAPLSLVSWEAALFARAHLVFTGGYSLYRAKRAHHKQVYAFPSSVDVEHFQQARKHAPDPVDQRAIPRPRIGHYAVLDERLDLSLLASIANARPEWQLVLIGPVVKIDPAELPRRPNIHYLGPKSYEELPAYLGGWDLAFMPFALNKSTRFISPTKTPEYLAAGLPVISTPIADVVSAYGEAGLVTIAGTADEFVSGISTLLESQTARAERLRKVDTLLANMSWDTTWAQMRDLVA